MKYIVVARYKEDVSWIDTLPKEWLPIVIQKRTDELEGDMPNIGREPSSYLLAIIQHYSAIQPDDTWCFVQGDPFPHSRNILDKMNAPAQGYVPFDGSQPIVVYHLDGKQLIYREPFLCDGEGGPHHYGLPIKICYEAWLAKPFPDQGVYFYPGGQFMLDGATILKRPFEWYKTIYDDIMDNSDNNVLPYVLERLWGSVFTVF